MLRFQITVSILTIDLQSNRLVTCLVTIQKIEHLNLKASFLSPSLIHTAQHARPVAALGAAGTCMKRQDGIILVVFSAQKRLNTDGFVFLAEFIIALLHLRNHIRIVLLLCDLNKHQHVFPVCTELLVALDHILQMLTFLYYRCRLLGIIPKSRFFHCLIQLFNPVFFVSQVKVNPPSLTMAGHNLPGTV